MTMITVLGKDDDDTLTMTNDQMMMLVKTGQQLATMVTNGVRSNHLIVLNAEYFEKLFKNYHYGVDHLIAQLAANNFDDSKPGRQSTEIDNDSLDQSDVLPAVDLSSNQSNGLNDSQTTDLDSSPDNLATTKSRSSDVGDSADSNISSDASDDSILDELIDQPGAEQVVPTSLFDAGSNTDVNLPASSNQPSDSILSIGQDAVDKPNETANSAVEQAAPVSGNLFSDGVSEPSMEMAEPSAVFKQSGEMPEYHGVGFNAAESVKSMVNQQAERVERQRTEANEEPSSDQSAPEDDVMTSDSVPSVNGDETTANTQDDQDVQRTDQEPVPDDLETVGDDDDGPYDSDAQDNQDSTPVEEEPENGEPVDDNYDDMGYSESDADDYPGEDDGNKDLPENMDDGAGLPGMDDFGLGKNGLDESSNNE